MGKSKNGSKKRNLSVAMLVASLVFWSLSVLGLAILVQVNGGLTQNSVTFFIYELILITLMTLSFVLLSVTS